MIFYKILYTRENHKTTYQPFPHNLDVVVLIKLTCIILVDLAARGSYAIYIVRFVGQKNIFPFQFIYEPLILISTNY